MARKKKTARSAEFKSKVALAAIQEQNLGPVLRGFSLFGFSRVRGGRNPFQTLQLGVRMENWLKRNSEKPRKTGLYESYVSTTRRKRRA
jgi:hypothetical protein